MKKLAIAMLLGAVAFLNNSAYAGIGDGYSAIKACKNDIDRYCGREKGNHDQMKQCLQRFKDQLTQQCLNALQKKAQRSGNNNWL